MAAVPGEMGDGRAHVGDRSRRRFARQRGAAHQRPLDRLKAWALAAGASDDLGGDTALREEGGESFELELGPAHVGAKALDRARYPQPGRGSVPCRLAQRQPSYARDSTVCATPSA